MTTTSYGGLAYLNYLEVNLMKLLHTLFTVSLVFSSLAGATEGTKNQEPTEMMPNYMDQTDQDKMAGFDDMSVRMFGIKAHFCYERKNNTETPEFIEEKARLGVINVGKSQDKAFDTTKATINYQYFSSGVCAEITQ